MKQIFILLLILVLVSCHSSKKVAGIYSSKHLLTNHTLELKADSTFIYLLEGGLLNQNSEGVWSINSLGNIVLNSYESLKPNITYVAVENKPIDNLKVRIVNELDNPLPYASVVLNDDELNLGFSLNENGDGECKFVRLKTIKVNYLGEEYYHSIIDDNDNANCILIRVRLKKISQLYLEREKWKVKGRKLINNANLVLTK